MNITAMVLLLIGSTTVLAYDQSHMERVFLYGVCQECDLVGGDFRGRNMRGVNLSRSNLSYANFSRADLSGANLSGANLSGADFSEAVWFDGRRCQQGSIGLCR